MNILLDFLNHGSIPFVGRQGEMERLLTLWHDTPNAQGLRMVLVSGEAGSGKSRLVEEVIEEIGRTAAGVVVHIRIYPDAPGSLLGLLVDALRTVPPPIGGLAQPDAVAGTLRRCARLRPTLLAIEDIHLLRGDTLRELTGLLDALVDEPLLVLAASRPLAAPVRGAVDPYLTAELALTGLGPDALAAMWRELLGAPPPATALDALAGATLGNPLAVRTALRRAIHPLVGTDSSGVSLPSPAILSEQFRHTVGLMSEGMTAHLTDAERDAAASLSTLGEVVSVAAARTLLGTSGAMLDRLVFKGVLARATVPTRPLFGVPGGEIPFVFTHTLLHRRLLELSHPDASRLLELIAASVPLYSAVPFQLLTEMLAGAHVAEQHAGVLEPMLSAAINLDATTDWELAPLLCRAAGTAVDAIYGLRDDVVAREAQGRVMSVRLALLRRTDHLEEYAQLIEDLLAITADAATETLIDHRLVALRYLHWKQRYNGDDALDPIWQEVEALADRFDGFRFRSIAYRAYLRMIAFANWNAMGQTIAARLERHLRALLDDPRADEDFHRYADEFILPLFLTHIGSAAQFAERRALLERLDSSIVSPGLWYLTAKLAFLFDTGSIDAMSGVAGQIEPILRALGDRIGQASLLSACLHIAIMTGEDCRPVIARFEEELEQLDEPTRLRVLTAGMVNLTLAGFFCGELREVRAFVGRHPDALQRLSATRRMLVALGAASDEAAVEEIDADETLREQYAVLLGYLRDTLPLDQVLREARGWLGLEIVRGEDLLRVIASVQVVDLVARMRGGGELIEGLRPEIRAALHRVFEWMEERTLAVPLRAWLDTCGRFLGRRNREQWRERQAVCERLRPVRRAPSAASLPTLTMFGTVGLRYADGREVPIRGGRLRALAGLMVADALLGHTLGWHEFAAIASEGEKDTERARRMLTMAVYRLRETIGASLILTDEETPRLDRTRVRVDLLEAHHALHGAQSAVRDGALLRAVPELDLALALAGDVPFPSLYDNFFEAAREDFEHLLRSTLLRVVDALCGAGDFADAERLLRRGVAVVQGDDEIAERLCALLATSGRRMEAERLRMAASAGAVGAVL